MGSTNRGPIARGMPETCASSGNESDEDVPLSSVAKALVSISSTSSATAGKRHVEDSAQGLPKRARLDQKRSCIVLGTRINPDQVIALGPVQSKGGRKRKRETCDPKAGMAANTVWGVCTLMSRCRGGWNVYFGDGASWFLATSEFTIV